MTAGDYDFAKKYGLQIKRVINNPDQEKGFYDGRDYYKFWRMGWMDYSKRHGKSNTLAGRKIKQEKKKLVTI